MELTQKSVLESILFRFSCRAFQEKQSLTKEEIDTILEAGRLAPSSYGLEPWRFVAVNQTKDIQELSKASYYQKSFENAALAITIFHYGEKKAAPEALMENFLFHMPKEYAETSQTLLPPYLKAQNLSPKNYTAAQAHIVSGFMTLQAASLGIDSLIVGGIEPKKVASLYGYELEEYTPVLVLLFGYRAMEQGARVRFPKEKTIDDRTSF